MISEAMEDTNHLMDSVAVTKEDTISAATMEAHKVFTQKASGMEAVMASKKNSHLEVTILVVAIWAVTLSLVMVILDSLLQCLLADTSGKQMRREVTTDIHQNISLKALQSHFFR